MKDVQLANWMKVNSRQDGSALAAKLVHDHYYDSCYLYNNPNEIDHQYTYIIFVGDGETLIFCYNQYYDRKVFCYTPQEVLNKYMDDMDYTDFANGEIRNDAQVHVYASDKPKHIAIDKNNPFTD